MSDRNKNKKHKDYKEKKNILEFAVFYCSLALVLGLLAYLTYAAITIENTEPQLEVDYSAAPQGNTPFLYKVSVKNTGTNTAEDVVIELVQEKNGKKIEEGQLKIMFVSGGNSVDGWVNFRKEPAKADTLYARIISYKSS